MEDEQRTLFGAIIIVGILSLTLLYVATLPYGNVGPSVVPQGQANGGGASSTVPVTQTTTSPSTSTTAQYNRTVCYAATDSCANAATALGLSLHTGKGANGSLYINASDINTLNSSNNVTAVYVLGVKHSALSYIGYVCAPPAIPTVLVGISRGTYNLSNINSSHGLPLAEPWNGPPPACPIPISYMMKYFIFAPGSDYVTNASYGLSGSDSLNISVGRYWNGTAFTALASGQYTVVAADRWGQVDILHLDVS